MRKKRTPLQKGQGRGTTSTSTHWPEGDGGGEKGIGGMCKVGDAAS